MLDCAFVHRAAEEETLAILVMEDRGARAMRARTMRYKGGVHGGGGRAGR